MKQAIIAAIASVALMFITPAAFGQEEGSDKSGVYIGFAGGFIHEDLPQGFGGYDRGGVFRGYGGYRWKNGGALEFSYNRFADLKVSCLLSIGGPTGVIASGNTVERQSFSLNGLYHFPLGSRLSVFPKVGFAYARVDDGSGNCLQYSDDTATGFLFGGGAEFRILDNLAFRADIEKGTSRLDDEKFIWSAGFSFYF